MVVCYRFSASSVGGDGTRIVKKRTLAQRIVTVILAAALIALSGTMAWATAYDYRERGLVPRGVTINGTDLSGMDEAEAREAIESAVSAPLLRPVGVVADGREFTFDPSEAVAVDVDGMLEQAYAPRRTASFVARVRHDVAGSSLPADIQPLFSVDAAAVATWLDEVVAKVDRPAVDATLTVVDSRVRIAEEVAGRKTDRERATEAIVAALKTEAALAAGDREVEIPVAEVAAEVEAASFGKTIVVDLSERRIRLFDGAKIEKTYPCAIGTPQYPTPKGEFEITLKRYRPTWVNPGSDWAKTMPSSIPPGPQNPLGTRAINLSASGIRFHGTTNIGSVGTAASHGCMRMYRHDIEDLYERVEVGMKVYIVP